MRSRLVLGLCLASIAVAAVAAEPASSWPPTIARKLPPAGKPLDEAVRNDLQSRLAELTKRTGAVVDPEVAIFLKAVDYALRHGEFFDAKKDAAQAATQLNLAEERLSALAKGESPWAAARGNVVRGYRSQLDDSVQPYGLVIPEGLDLSKPVPLYVWLHGRGDTKCDLQFIAGFLGEKPVGPLQPANAIVLHPFGRYCNGWKSAGEVDVFEAIADVKKKYKIDDDRVLLGGFSMGGAGAWHLGAHYTDRWCAVHAGAGFVDVRRYQNVTAENIPPWYEVKLWGLYDVPDYRRNLLNVPLLAYSGEEDKQKASADIMEAELAEEGLKLTHLIGPKMGHKYHPDVLIDIHQRLATIVERGRNPSPSRVRLQTKTLRYNKMFWVEVLGLKQHWEDSRVDAQLTGPKSIVITTKNVTSLKLREPWGPGTPFAADLSIVIDEQQIAPPASAKFGGELYLVNRAKGWVIETELPFDYTPGRYRRKSPGLQGPLDDAFVERFAVHKPTTSGDGGLVDRWVDFESQHFLDRWRMLMRGEAPTQGEGHQILWGTPTTNPQIKEIVDKLPIEWNDKTVGMGDLQFDATKVVPMLIYPHPSYPTKYVVLNSGLTFREAHDRTNSLQNPKLGDWAFIDVTEPPTDEAPGKVLAAGFFDEEWRYVPAK